MSGQLICLALVSYPFHNASAKADKWYLDLTAVVDVRGGSAGHAGQIGDGFEGVGARCGGCGLAALAGGFDLFGGTGAFRSRVILDGGGALPWRGHGHGDRGVR